MTHSELVEAAARWLRSQGCAVVITEMATIGEEADAIGWKSRGSILVECKASRSDFLADRAKPHRRHPQLGAGCLRYILAPAGMVRVEELPERWGLVEVSESGKTRRVAKALGWGSQYNRLSEIGILLSAMRRIVAAGPVRGVSAKVYTIESKNRATIGVEPEEAAVP